MQASSSWNAPIEGGRPVSTHLVQACAAVVGPSNVLVDEADKQAFEQDVWNRYRGNAALVARPGTVDEVSKLLVVAAEHGASVVPQGGNTGLVAGSIPDETGRQIVLSLSRINRIRHVEPRGDFVIAEAGVVLADIQKAAEQVDRSFPLSLGAEGSCQIGGNIATNAGGLNVLRYGMTRGLILGLEVVLADGTIWNGLRSVRKDNTGYDLKEIFVGSEGTLGIITAASLRLLPPQRDRQTIWLAVASAEAAVDLFARFRSHFGDLISSFELIHSNGVELAVEYLEGCRRPLSDRHQWHVLIELAWALPTGLREQTETFLEQLFEYGLCEDGTIAESEMQRLNMWRIREGQSEAARKRGVVIRSDVAVSIERLPGLLHAMEEWTKAQDTDILFMPFGHVGDGNLHCNCLVSPHVVGEIEPRLLEALYDEVTQLGGSISAEHGIGRLKSYSVGKRKSDVELRLAHSIKRLLDPCSILNPGVIFGTASSEAAPAAALVEAPLRTKTA
jgi:FAD/FMN-containing dehydrogenase